MTRRLPRRAVDAPRSGSRPATPAIPVQPSGPDGGARSPGPDGAGARRGRGSQAAARRRARRRAGPWLAVAAMAALAALAWWAVRDRGAADRPIGGVYACRALPRFVAGLGFGGQSALSTSERRHVGLVLTDGQRVYQHPSWSSAGYLAPIQLDREGNVFVVPAPQINVLDNPPEAQNIVYKVDTDSGEMARYLELPAAAPSGDTNPFGALGLAYDCDTDTLYVSSVAGSTRRAEVGRIFQIDTRAPAVLAQFDGVDAIGVGVFNGAAGKRLYYGLARAPEIWSIALDAAGRFVGSPRFELSLEGLGPRGDDKARRIRFEGTDMLVHGIAFAFNLVAPTEKQETLYRFAYDPASDGWRRVDEGG